MDSNPYKFSLSNGTVILKLCIFACPLKHVPVKSPERIGPPTFKFSRLTFIPPGASAAAAELYNIGSKTRPVPVISAPLLTKSSEGNLRPFSSVFSSASSKTILPSS